MAFRIAILIALSITPAQSALSAQDVAFRRDGDRLVVTAGKSSLATYAFRDAKITRPYFAHLYAPGGMRVSRHHPPIAGKDATDHADFHPGLWLAFGDLSGADSWRLKARVRHGKFLEEPKGGKGEGSFAVLNYYLSNDGKSVLCQETLRCTFLIRPSGHLILWDSEFRSLDRDFSFGDQEEMGLGIRVATPLTVKAGGQILTSDGHINEKQVRGKTSPWCDSSGRVGGKRAGILLMQHPKNFRPAWYHARDYGFVAVNPFGRNALTGGIKSKVIVKKGESLRLRFGILLHASSGILDLRAAHADYLRLARPQ